MSQTNDGTFTKLYKVAVNMSPETRKLWLDAFNRAVEVAAEADAAAEAELAKERQHEEQVDTSELGKNIDYAINILEQMKHKSNGGSIKRSINCRRPHGFSQRQHCKYGRRGRGWTTTRRKRTR